MGRSTNRVVLSNSLLGRVAAVHNEKRNRFFSLLEERFLLVHFSYITFLALIGTIYFCAVEGCAFIDGFFVAVSCVSCTGLTSVDVADWTTGSTVLRHVLMVLGGAVFTSSYQPFFRALSLGSLHRRMTHARKRREAAAAAAVAIMNSSCSTEGRRGGDDHGTRGVGSLSPPPVLSATLPSSAGMLSTSASSMMSMNEHGLPLHPNRTPPTTYGATVAASILRAEVPPPSTDLLDAVSYSSSDEGDDDDDDDDIRDRRDLIIAVGLLRDAAWICWMTPLAYCATVQGIAVAAIALLNNSHMTVGEMFQRVIGNFQSCAFLSLIPFREDPAVTLVLGWACALGLTLCPVLFRGTMRLECTVVKYFLRCRNVEWLRLSANGNAASSRALFVGEDDDDDDFLAHTFASDATNVVNVTMSICECFSCRSRRAFCLLLHDDHELNISRPQQLGLLLGSNSSVVGGGAYPFNASITACSDDVVGGGGGVGAADGLLSSAASAHRAEGEDDVRRAQQQRQSKNSSNNSLGRIAHRKKRASAPLFYNDEDILVLERLMGDSQKSPNYFHCFLFRIRNVAFLGGAFLAITSIQFLPYLWQQWSGPNGVLGAMSSSTAQKLNVAWSQSMLTRFSGGQFLDPTRLSNGHLGVILLCMYLPAVPFSMDESVLRDKYVKGKHHPMWKRTIWRLFTSRLLWLFSCSVLICMIDEEGMRNALSTSHLDAWTRTVFEVVSGYSGSGLTLAIGGENSPVSFSGSLSSASKFFITLVMFAGRHRAMGMRWVVEELDEQITSVRQRSAR